MVQKFHFANFLQTNFGTLPWNNHTTLEPKILCFFAWVFLHALSESEIKSQEFWHDFQLEWAALYIWKEQYSKITCFKVGIESWLAWLFSLIWMLFGGMFSSPFSKVSIASRSRLHMLLIFVYWTDVIRPLEKYVGLALVAFMYFET